MNVKISLIVLLASGCSHGYGGGNNGTTTTKTTGGGGY